MSAAANRMAAKVAESATKAAGKATQSGSSTGVKKGPQTVLQKGRKPTSTSSEAPVSMAEGTMPWQASSDKNSNDELFKYKYHPGGDPNRAPKNAPSALHSTIIPNVTLPKSWHDQFNKWGKDEYDF
ncbi:MAG: hypothetical protein Q9219_001113 [cf. Caloplaca sp. 3 TL-2023]